MLTVIREYAYAALVARDEDDATRRKHALRYCALAAAAEPYLLTSRQKEWIARLAADNENLRAAMDWTLETNEGDLALNTVGSLWRFWQIQGMVSEARERIGKTLRLAHGSPLARAKALEADGGIAYWEGDWDRSREPYEEALSLVRANGSDSELAHALYNAAFPIAFAGYRPLGDEYLRESLKISESLGDRLGIGRAHWGLGGVAQYVQDHDATIKHTLLAAAEFEDLDAPFDLGWTYAVLADTYLRVDRIADARIYIDRASHIFADSGDLSAAVLILQIKSYILSLGGDDVSAAKALGAAEGIKKETGLKIGDIEANQHERGGKLLADTRQDVRRALETGRNLTLGEALALAESI
jgi:tetratricopeptide (TPR) repeat protein